MLQRTYLMLIGCCISLFAVAQKTTPAPKPAGQQVVIAPPPPQPMPTFNFKKINDQLAYAFIINKPTSPKPEEGDQINVNMQSVCNNRLMYSTWIAFKGKPAVFGVNKPSFKGDLIEAIMYMTPGDSIVCQVDADALFKNSKSKKPDFIKSGDKMLYFIKLVSIKPKLQVQKEQQAAFTKQMNEQMAKQKAEAAKQMIKDDKELKAYFTKKNITPTKTASGLYYTIQSEGSGDLAIAGDSVTMNYTGTLMDGTKFDSNVDTAFHHVMPFNFVLGRGQVIKGWDEGVALLKKGTKATLYIPSPMAYGPQARPGGGANPKGIPANSILIFDVELVEIKKPIPVKTPEMIETKKDSSSTPEQIKPVENIEEKKGKQIEEKKELNKVEKIEAKKEEKIDQ